MQFKHSNRAVSLSFDDPNLVSSAGLIPMMVLAVKTGLGALVDERVKLPGYFGANAGLKVGALVAGMLTGADSIDDMAVLRHGALRKLFKGTYAPSTLGSFLRAFTFGHVRQLDAAASRWLVNLAAVAPIVLVLMSLPWSISMTPSRKSTDTRSKVRGLVTRKSVA